MSRLFAILMAGGSGTRFWPVSRTARPKQLLPIGTEEPLIVETSRRLGALVPPERQLVVTSSSTVDAVRALLPQIPAAQVLGEPEGRDTAPCVGLAAGVVQRLDPDAVAVALPSDHVVAPAERFREVLAVAEEALQRHPDAVLVFGVSPTGPSTAYGYLRRGAPVDEVAGHRIFALDAFVEKPDEARAQALLDAGDCSWNAGLFAFRPAALLAAYERLLPDMARGLDRLARAWGGAGFEPLLAEVFPTLQKVSIDYGLMEHLPDCLLLPLEGLAWDDVGSWSALERLLSSDEEGNVVDGDVVVQAGRGNVLVARGGVVAARGVDGLIIVHTPDATLVCRKDDDQGVKALVEALRARGLAAHL